MNNSTATTASPGHNMLDEVIRFSRVLHNGGITINSSNLIDLCHSIKHIDIANRVDFYAAARANLISNVRDI